LTIDAIFFIFVLPMRASPFLWPSVEEKETLLQEIPILFRPGDKGKPCFLGDTEHQASDRALEKSYPAPGFTVMGRANAAF
jgi:hypothetical protein